MAAMHIDDAFDDRQAEARRTFSGRRLGREPLEAAEQPAEILRREAGALVGDADHRVAALMGDGHRDLAADRRVFDGVADEVVDRLADPGGLAPGYGLRWRRHGDGL